MLTHNVGREKKNISGEKPGIPGEGHLISGYFKAVSASIWAQWEQFFFYLIKHWFVLLRHTEQYHFEYLWICSIVHIKIYKKVLAKILLSANVFREDAK